MCVEVPVGGRKDTWVLGPKLRPFGKAESTLNG